MREEWILIYKILQILIIYILCLKEFKFFLFKNYTKTFKLAHYTLHIQLFYFVCLLNVMRFSTRTSLTINKYLEEFPGLVHFIYIDRNTHRLVAPTLDFTSTETLALTMKKVSYIKTTSLII